MKRDMCETIRQQLEDVELVINGEMNCHTHEYNAINRLREICEALYERVEELSSRIGCLEHETEI